MTKRETKEREGSDSEPLSPTHIKYLADRAISEGPSISQGLQSVDQDQAQQLLGRDKPVIGGGLWIPYPSGQAISDGYGRLRLDDPDANDGARYLSPRGIDVPVYLTDGALDEVAPLFIVESPIKALALQAAGFAAIGLGGVATTVLRSEGATHLGQSWDPVPLEGRTVYIVYDANCATSTDVARARANLASALQHERADVMVVTLPPAKRGEDQGPDDFIASHGVDAFKQLVLEAEQAAPYERSKQASKQQLTSLADDLAWRVAIDVAGEAERSRVRDVFKAQGMTTVFDRCMKALAKKKRAQAKKRSLDGASQEVEYGVEDGRLASRRGELVRVIAEFDATIEKELRIHDGRGTERCFVVRATGPDGRDWGTTRVSAQQMEGRSWALDAFGTEAVVHGSPDELRRAIQMTSDATVVVDIYKHTGWTERDLDSPAFLLPQGSVGSAARPELPNYAADYGVTADPDNRQGFHLVLSLLDVCPARVVAAILGGVCLGPLQAWMPSDFVVWVEGQTGVHKSTLVALMLCLFGDFDTTRLPLSWNSTPAALENALFLLKDVTVVIDDYVRRGTTSHDPVVRIAEEVIRSLGNRSSKERMFSDMTAQNSFPPRGFVICTGESGPEGQSIVARTLRVRLREGEVDREMLTAVQSRREELRTVGFTLVSYLARRATAMPEAHRKHEPHPGPEFDVGKLFT